jgi:hypothetical protein
MMLTREALLAAALPTEDVHVPELGGVVRVVGMTARERDNWDRFLIAASNGQPAGMMPDFRANLIIRTVRDEAGARLFSDADLEAVAALPCTVLDRLIPVAARLSGLGRSLESEPRSGSTQPDALPTSSPSGSAGPAST